jgi:hypothetical protein
MPTTTRAAVSAKRSLPRSTCRALEKLVQRIDGSEDRPRRNRGDDAQRAVPQRQIPNSFRSQNNFGLIREMTSEPMIAGTAFV